MYKSVLIILVFLSLPYSSAHAQGEGQFGCLGRTQLYEHAAVQFSPISDDALEQWKTRPGLAFEGFDEKKYGFRQIAFYRWREPLELGGDSTAPMAGAILAVRLVGSHGDRWFEWEPISANADDPHSATPRDLLYIQAGQEGETPEQVSDSLVQSFIVRPASSDPTLPLFLLEFGYTANSTGPVLNRLLLDARTGKPEISKAVQCVEPPAANGTCDSPKRITYDHLSCSWDQPAGDFRCNMTSPFGEDSGRLAARPFYLFANKPALPDWSTSQTVPDLGAFALEMNRGRSPAGVTMVPGYGPVTLLARYKDLLPETEVFVFASPGAGATANAHLTLVSVSAQGRTEIADIPKAVLSGEKTDESPRPEGYAPLGAGDRYHTKPLVDRPGFHALQAVLSTNSEEQPPSPPVHVVYWIGLENAEGRLISSAVRVASDGLTYGRCAEDAHDGSAISIEQQQGMAAATVHVRPPDVPSNTSAEEAADSEVLSGCVWIGALYWSPGAGFQIHKTDDSCETGVPQVSISEDGRITVKATQVTTE